ESEASQIAALERQELASPPLDNQQAGRLLLLYLLSGDLCNARLLWRRTPQALRSGASQPLANIWRCGAALFSRDYSTFYTAAADAAASTAAPMPPDLADLLARLVTKTRRDRAAALAAAYSCIGRARLAKEVGVSPSGVAEALPNWRVGPDQGDSGFLAPPEPAATAADAPLMDTFEAIQKLSATIGFVENH
ncbi:hypothetical protein BOX15_Mlig005725g2, partial [Macrostomum lignano]